MKKHIQAIMSAYQKNSHNKNKFSKHKVNVMQDISACRTSELGAHIIDKCDSCDYVKISYNSCRNRHCPICQSYKKELWVEKRKSELINVPYFHVVFTVPAELNPIIYANQEITYDLMFKLAKESLVQLSLDPKYLGAEIGITAVLHTWGQNLMFHPHVHCIVPGGGISSSGIEFKRSRKKFFLPVKALSKLFMNKFLKEVRRLLTEERLFVPAQLDAKEIISGCFEKKWVIYCKRPFKGPFHVIKYLSRYTHKIAITDSRVLSSDSETVTFNWRDYSDNNRKKIMTLSCGEFVRRFMLHVLPRKFVKIRYYGILGTRNRKSKLLKCQMLSGMKSIYKARSKAEILSDILGAEALCCPNCGSPLARWDINKKATLRE